MPRATGAVGPPPPAIASVLGVSPEAWSLQGRIEATRVPQKQTGYCRLPTIGS